MKSEYHFKFEELQIYQKTIDYGEFINELISHFPIDEKYRMASQFIRAADSIALNIAEGSSSSKANFNRYLQMAWDSSNKCVVCGTKAFKRNYISFEDFENNRKYLTELSKMITSYKKYLKKNLNN